MKETVSVFFSEHSVFLGTCESLFVVRIESRIESAVRFVYESNLRIESSY